MPYHLATPANYQREHYNNNRYHGQLSCSPGFDYLTEVDQELMYTELKDGTMTENGKSNFESK